jgi:hypothetical protein
MAHITATDGAEDVVNAPVVLNPGSTVADGTLVKTEYYLNNKLIATRTSAPFSYQLQSQNFANGTYTLTVKRYYSSGNMTTTSQKLVIKNPASFKQFMLTAQKYLPQASIAIVLIAVAAFFAVRFFLRRRRAMQQAAMEQLATPDLSAFQAQYQAPPTPTELPQEPLNGYPYPEQQPGEMIPPAPQSPTQGAAPQHEDLPHLVARTMYQRHNDDPSDQPRQ